jgi:hypothetical protein
MNEGYFMVCAPVEKGKMTVFSDKTNLPRGLLVRR